MPPMEQKYPSQDPQVRRTAPNYRSPEPLDPATLPSARFKNLIDISAQARIFLKSFPAHDSKPEAVEKLLHDIINRLDEKSIYTFLTETLRIAPARAQIGQSFSPLKTLELLKNSAENGSLDLALHVLMSLLPTEPLYKLVGTLDAIAGNVGPAASEVFNISIPLLLCREDDFTFTDLFVFSKLCTTARAETPRFCELLMSRLSGPMHSHLPTIEALSLVYQAGESVNRWAAVDCLNFCCDLLGTTDGERFTANLSKLMPKVSKAWEAWGEKDRVYIAEQFNEIFQKLHRPIPLRVTAEALSILTIPGDRAKQIVEQSQIIANTNSWEILISHLRRVAKLETMINSLYIGDATKLYAESEILDRADLTDKIVSTFSKVFGIERVQKRLKDFSSAIQRFSGLEIRDLEKDLKTLPDLASEMLVSDYPIEPSAAKYLTALMLIGGDDVFNLWKVPEAEIHRRWEDRVQFARIPIIKTSLSDVFEIPFRSEGYSFRFKENAKIDSNFANFIQGRQRVFTTPYPEIIGHTIREISKLLDIQYNYPVALKAAEVIPLLVQASEHEDPKVFERAVKMSFPLLTEATAVNLPHLDPEAFIQDPDAIYDFLESLRLFIDDRLPVTFEHAGMARPAIERIKQIACLDQITNHLKKLEKNDPNQMMDILLLGVKNALDAYYDQMAETCVLEKSADDLENPAFQPIRIISQNERKVLGCWYVLRADVNSLPSLILAGGGPQTALIKGVDTKQFVGIILEKFAEIAERNNLDGGIFQAVGPAGNGALYTEQGRIAQHANVRDEILRYTGELIQLPKSEHIEFPSEYFSGTKSSPTYFGPIQQVLRLHPNYSQQRKPKE